MSADFNPETHLRGEDGGVYERKIVAATLIAVGAHDAEKTAFAADLEAGMNAAVRKAHDDGVTDPQKIKQRIDKVRDEFLGQKNG